MNFPKTISVSPTGTRTFLRWLGVCAILLSSGSLLAEEESEREGLPALAREVMEAAGIENWPRVSQVKFTFNVDVNGERKHSVSHDWEVRKGRDTVTWDGKTATADVWNPEKNEGAEKAAYQRWVNDTYWLLAPLKLADKGVAVKALGMETVEGQRLPALELRFDKVGLTPGDQYVLYVDPETRRLQFWDYRPDADTRKTASWEDYVDKGGLALSTRHQMGDVVITITGLEILTD